MPRLHLTFHNTLLAQAMKELFDALPQYDCVDLDLADLVLTDAHDIKDKQVLHINHFPIKTSQLLREIDLKLQENFLTLGPYTLNLRGKEWISPDTTHKLTEKEVDILAYMGKRQGEEISKLELLENVWGHSTILDTHTLETHIYRLRQKIEKDPANPTLLLNNKEGYTLQLPSDEKPS